MPKDICTFVLEWFDQNAQMVRKFHMKFFKADNTLQLYDLDNSRIFLKRISYPSVKYEDLHLGACLYIYGRQFYIVEIADGTTKATLEKTRKDFFLLLGDSAAKDIGLILSKLQSQGVNVFKMRMVHLSGREATKYGIKSEIKDGIYVALKLVIPPNSVWTEYKEDLAANLIAKYGATSIYISELGDVVADAFFEINDIKIASADGHNTLCIIKPHVQKEKNTGDVILAIEKAGFEITGIDMTNIDGRTAEEFFGVYRGVIPEYADSVKEFSSGPSIALQIHGQDEGIVEKFREFCGPYNVELAKVLRPNSLRSQFGQNAAMNAVHCTDLPEDGGLESKYFFTLLPRGA